MTVQHQSSCGPLITQCARVPRLPARQGEACQAGQAPRRSAAVTPGVRCTAAWSLPRQAGTGLRRPDHPPGTSLDRRPAPRPGQGPQRSIRQALGARGASGAALTASRGSDSIDVAPKTLQHRFPQTPPRAVLQSDASAGSAADIRPFGGRSPRVLCRVFGSRHQRRPLARPEKPHTGAFHAKRHLLVAGEAYRRHAAGSAGR